MAIHETSVLDVTNHTPDGNVPETACLLTAKLADIERGCDERTLEAASRRFRGGIGLQKLLLEAV